MDRHSYEQLIESAKAEATDAIGRNPSEQRTRHVLDIFAQRVAAATRDFHLTNLMGIDDAAQRLGVAPANVRQMLIRRNRTSPVGAKIGKNTWIIDIDELPLLERDERRKNE